MPANLIGQSGVSWGLNAETGLLVSSFNQTTKADKKEVKNNVGDVAAVSMYNQLADISMDAAIAGSYPVTAGGTLPSLANWASGYGTSATGTIVVESVENQKSNEEFQKMDIKAMRYNLF
jgi:hypothetical protein